MLLFYVVSFFTYKQITVFILHSCIAIEKSSVSMTVFPLKVTCLFLLAIFSIFFLSFIFHSFTVIRLDTNILLL